jgi:hypothetical protein
MLVRPQSLWWVTRDGNLDCLDLYLRHYSSAKANRTDGDGDLFVGPGNKLVLHIGGRACFVWRKFVDDCIDERTGEKQQGVNCAVFRNESEHLSSSLIRQADAIADAVWTDRRHYTYVRREAVASKNPRFCFLMAGWRRCGVTKSGLLVMERITQESERQSQKTGIDARSNEPEKKGIEE